MITGNFLGSVDFGGGPFLSAGGMDIFLAKFDGNGTHLWSQRFGHFNDQSGQSVAFDASWNVITTGYFQGIVDFGGDTLTSAGSSDIFLAKFSIQVGVEEEEYSNEKLEMTNVKLYQNHPNPFHKLTAISYQIPSSNPASRIPSASPSGGHHVSLSIYDITGRLVKTLVDELQDPGLYQIPITNNQLPSSGIYFYRLDSGKFTSTKKLIFFH
jgi:hypothetical protein